MRLAALGTLLVCLTVGAQASTVIFNDGFNGSVPGSYQNITSGHSLGPWQVGGGGIDWIGGYWQPYEGNGSIDLSGLNAGDISTALATVAGEKYTLTFWLAGNPDGGGGPKTVLVSVGSVLETFTFPGGGSTTSMGWVEETVNFTATSNDVLQFSSLNFTPYGPALDAVTVTSAIPEPASMLLAGAGLLAVSGLLRLRKRLQK